MIEQLTKLEGYVLGTLLEKENLVPNAYPLTLKRVHQGVTQRTSRVPRMYATMPEVQLALDSLISYGLVKSQMTIKLMRYEHHLWDNHRIPRQALPILACLLLRGHQTTAELRMTISRMYGAMDADVIEQNLRALTAKHREDPLVEQIPPMEGTREPRWSETLTGRYAAPPTGPITIDVLQKEVTNLKSRLEFIEVRLGIRSKVL